MISEANQTDKQTTNSPSLLTKYQKAIEAISTSPNDALTSLLEVRTRVTALDLFSLKNETMLDIPTSYLPFLSMQHHIAMAYIAAPTKGTIERCHNMKLAMDLFYDFLRRMEDFLSSSEGEEGRLYRDNNIRKHYHDLLDKFEEHGTNQNEWDDTDDNEDVMMTLSGTGESRDEKIARFKRRRQIENDIEALQAQRGNHRNDCEGDNEHDENGDDESLLRELYIKQLILFCMISMEELYTCHKEMEMLQMAMKMEQHRQEMEKFHGSRNSNAMRIQGNNNNSNHQTQVLPKKPIEVTHITQDPTTGKLITRKEQIQSTVFRPSWNLPTMTLAELGERERAAAIQRSQHQKAQEETMKFQPKRYEQLVAEELEDDIDLADASAKLDRQWDDFKDKNPRGCGNKMGDRGDRNF